MDKGLFRPDMNLIIDLCEMWLEDCGMTKDHIIGLRYEDIESSVHTYVSNKMGIFPAHLSEFSKKRIRWWLEKLRRDFCIEKGVPVVDQGVPLIDNPEFMKGPIEHVVLFGEEGVRVMEERRVDDLAVGRKKPWGKYADKSGVSEDPIPKKKRGDSFDEAIKEAYDRGYKVGKSEDSCISPEKVAEMLEEARREAVQSYKESIPSTSTPTSSGLVKESLPSYLVALGLSKMTPIPDNTVFMVLQSEIFPGTPVLESFVNDIEKVCGRRIPLLCLPSSVDVQAVSEAELSDIGFQKIPGHSAWKEKKEPSKAKPKTKREPSKPKMTPEEEMKALMEIRKKEREW